MDGGRAGETVENAGDSNSSIVEQRSRTVGLTVIGAERDWELETMKAGVWLTEGRTGRAAAADSGASTAEER